MKSLHTVNTAIFIFILSALLIAVISSGISKAQPPNSEHVLYAENFKENIARGWDLEPGWVVDDGTLVGRGHRWAQYQDVNWGDGRLVVKFKLTILVGTIHTNVLVSKTGRYAVSLRRQAPGNRLRIVLFKQLWPDTFFNDLAIAETREFDADLPSEVTIISDRGSIAVMLDGRSVFRYQDPSPLPPGTIAFETLEGSVAEVDDIIVTGMRPAEVEYHTTTSEDRLRLQTVYPRDFPIAGALAEKLTDFIRKQSKGNIHVELYGSGELFSIRESVKAVNEGTVDAVFGPALFFHDTPALQLFAGIPTGPGPMTHYKWLHEGSGRELQIKAYASHGVRGIPCGLIGTDGFWSKRPLNKSSDFNELTGRSSGLAGKTFKKLGVLLESIKPNAVAQALERGELAVAELSAPYVDPWFGLQGESGYYYYYPSWHQPVLMLELLTSESRWQRLLPGQRQSLEDWCHEITLQSIAEDQWRATQALHEMKVRGVKVLEWPPVIREAARAAWESVADEEGRKDPQFRRIYQAYQKILPAQRKREVTKRPLEPTKPTAPKIDPIDQSYEITKGANIRARPDIRSKRIGGLRAGEKVTALGKVAGKNWYLVARNGKELGYIYGTLLAPEKVMIPERRKSPADKQDKSGPIIRLDRSQIETNEAFVVISGTLEDESAITKLSINGTLADFSMPDRSFRVTRMVELGKTELRLEAEDEWGNRGKATFVIIRSGQEKGPAASDTIPTKPRLFKTIKKRYAIIIGISDYENLPDQPKKLGDLADLKYADKDAQAFAEFLEDDAMSGGVWKTYTFYNEQAIRSKVYDKLTEVLHTSTRRNDLVYIFFSGHGRSHDLRPEDIHLLTYDFDPQDYSSGLSYDWLQRLINQSPAKHVITFVDACRSGVIGFGKTAGARGAFNQDIFDRRWPMLGEQTNKAIFSAGSGDQLSFEDEDLRHGAFTYFLLKGLRGEAPENNKYPQTVDLGELELYVSEKVRDYTREHKTLFTQTPKIQGIVSHDFPVAVRKGK